MLGLSVLFFIVLGLFVVERGVMWGLLGLDFGFGPLPSGILGGSAWVRMFVFATAGVFVCGLFGLN